MLRFVRHPSLNILRVGVCLTSSKKACLLLTLYCHRFIIAAVTVSTKGLCDAFCTNQLYAKVGGITVTELNSLEREFLSAIDWRLMCTRDALNDYYTNLVRTNSSGRYVLAGYNSPNGSESDIEIDSGQSRDPSPEVSTSPARLRSAEPSTILIDPSIHAPPPPEGTPRATLEQNMAFAALQQSQSPSEYPS